MPTDLLPINNGIHHSSDHFVVPGANSAVDDMQDACFGGSWLNSHNHIYIGLTRKINYVINYFFSGVRKLMIQQLLQVFVFSENITKKSQQSRRRLQISS